MENQNSLFFYKPGSSILLILFLMFSSGISFAQDSYNSERKILLYIQPTVLQFPARQNRTISIDSVTISSQLLRQTFNEFKIDELTKAFPDFNDADSIRYTEEGLPVRVPRFGRIFKIIVDEKINIDSVIAVFSRVPGVLFAEKNIDAKLGSEPQFNFQWHLKNTGPDQTEGGISGADIKANLAWQIFTGSPDIKIAIVDVGVSLDHEEFAGKISGDGIDATGQDWQWSHGTHVAGIAAAWGNNGQGGSGVDWYARIDSRKIFDGFGNPVDNDIIANKILSAVNSGDHIINNSWGWNGTDVPTIHMAFAFAYKMNRVSTACMMNYNSSTVYYPAGYDRIVIAVGATQNNDTRSPFSSFGGHIDVVAPGGYNSYPNVNSKDIWSTWRTNSSGNRYGYLAGTSMSTPMVSGIASLLKGYNTELDNDDIVNIIRLSADDKGTLGWDQYYGFGRVNAYKSLLRLRGPYTITHSSTVGGTDQGASATYQMYIYGGVGLEDGLYNVKRHEV